MVYINWFLVLLSDMPEAFKYVYEIRRYNCVIQTCETQLYRVRFIFYSANPTNSESYELDDQGSIPGGDNVQTDSRDHPATYTMGNRGFVSRG